MLKLTDIEKTYGGKKRTQVRALRGISTEFGDFGLVFILGRSGSGKTTLMNIMGGLDRPTSGEIVVNGNSLSKYKEQELDGYRNKVVGFVFQEYNLLSGYSAGRNIALALELQGEKDDREKVDKIMRRVGLIDENGSTLYDRKVNELSGGQKQRVAIARALVKNPQIILADEPTGALDAITGEELYGLLKELSKERLVVVVTHDEVAAKRYGDRIIRIADGLIESDTENSIGEKAENNHVKEAPPKGGRLPLKRAFVMGAQSLRYKKIRLALSVFLSAFMCFVVGVLFAAATINKTASQIQALYDNGISIVIVESIRWYPEDEQDTSGLDHLTSQVPFTAKQKRALQQYFGKMMISITREAAPASPIWPSCEGNFSKISDYLFATADSSLPTFNPYLFAVGRPFDALVELDPMTGMEDAGLSPDSRFVDSTLCHLPKNTTEIAISDAKLDMFIRFGYKDAGGVVYEINKPDDMIGRKIGDLTVVGIYSTEETRESLAELDGQISIMDPNRSYLIKRTEGAHPVNFGFVSQGFISNRYHAFTELPSSTGGVSYLDDRLSALVRLDANPFKDTLFFLNDQVRYKADINDVDGMFIDLALKTPFDGLMKYWIEWATNETVVKVMWGLGIAFILASIMLIMTYLSISIQMRESELGILRATGATVRDVVFVCLFESLIVAAISFVLALIEFIVFCSIMNSIVFRIPLLLGFISELTLFLICFGVNSVATIFPAWRIAKQKPIDIIARNVVN